MVEHLVWDQGVAGSSPVYPTIVKLIMSKIIDSIKSWICGTISKQSYIEFEWDEECNEKHNSFLLKHLEECSSASPWISFRYVEGKMLKKITCPICGDEMIIGA